MSEQRRIPIIEQRRLEAHVLASVYEELQARRGEAEASTNREAVLGIGPVGLWGTAPRGRRAVQPI